MISKFNSLSLRAQAIVITAGIVLSIVLGTAVVSFVPVNVMFGVIVIGLIGAMIYVMYSMVLQELTSRKRYKDIEARQPKML